MKIISINDNDYFPLPRDTKHGELIWNKEKKQRPEQSHKNDSPHNKNVSYKRI